MDIPPGVDAGERVVGACYGVDPEQVADLIPLELFDGRSQPEAAELVADPGILRIKPQVFDLLESDLLILDPDEAVGEGDERQAVREGLALRPQGIDPDEQGTAVMKEVLAHQVPGAGEVVLGKAPDLVPELFVLIVVAGLGGRLEPEQKGLSPGSNDLLELVHDHCPPATKGGGLILAEHRTALQTLILEGLHLQPRDGDDLTEGWHGDSPCAPGATGTGGKRSLRSDHQNSNGGTRSRYSAKYPEKALDYQFTRGQRVIPATLRDLFRRREDAQGRAVTGPQFSIS